MHMVAPAGQMGNCVSANICYLHTRHRLRCPIQTPLVLLGSRGASQIGRLVRSLFIVSRLFRSLRSVQKCPESRTTINPRGDPPREFPAGKALGRGNCALAPPQHSTPVKIDAAIYLRREQIKTIDVKLIRRCNSAQSKHTRTYAIVFNIRRLLTV